MKILETSFDSELQDKEDTIHGENIVYTGRIRIIRTTLGKIKEQKEFHIIKQQWDLWNNKKHRILHNGPHWM